ncbi:MAG: Flp family type IVb pilin [Alphaproteobacteria bacterium]|nr:MAG: Flp family type IVb pilin [Alphaproteobacteria bacterium]
MKLLVVAFRCLARAEAGVTGLEYGLLASLMGVVIFASVAAVGLQVGNKFTTLTQSFNPARDLQGPTGPPPEEVMAYPGSNGPDHASDVAQDIGSARENEIGGVVWGTGESIAPAASLAADTGGPVILSAKDLLAAAQGSSLGAAPAAGPRALGIGATENDFGQSAGNVGRQAAIGGGEGGSLASSRAGGSFKIGQTNHGAEEGAARLLNGGFSGEGMTSENQPNLPSGSGGGVMGLLGLFAALLGLVVVIWKLVRRARFFSNTQRQINKWQRNREDKQGRQSVRAFSPRAGATT